MQHGRETLAYQLMIHNHCISALKANPGTGKTMVARTIVDTIYNIAVIKTPA